MIIPLSVIESIKQKADIVQIISSYINVIKKGNSYVALCPFHADKHPSLMISKTKQIYKCFSCGAGGDVFTFVQNYEKISYFDAVRKVAELIGFTDPSLKQQERFVDDTTRKELKALKDAAEVYHYALKSRDGQKAKEYFLNRGITLEMQDYFNLGYCYQNGEISIKMLRGKNHDVTTLERVGILNRSHDTFVDRFASRVMFPIYNEFDDVIGFSGRIIDNSDSSKYMNSPNTAYFNKSNVLYNYQNAKKEAKREGCVYIVEGFMDVFALYKAGIKSVIAVMGTAFTANHAKILRKFNVELRLLLDGDEAGRHGMVNIIDILDKEGIKNYRIVDYRESELDPDEILQKYGEKVLNQFANRLIDKYEFLFQYYRRTLDLESIEGKKQFISLLIPHIVKMNSLVEKEAFIKKVSEASGISIQAFEEEVNNAKDDTNIDFNIFRENNRKNKSYSRLQLAEKELLYQMITNPRAIDDFLEGGNNYFIDSIYEVLANYVIDIYETNHSFVVGDLITQLKLNQSKETTALIDELTELSLEKDHQPYSHEGLMETLDTIHREIIKKNRKERLKDLLITSDPHKQAEAATAYFEERKEIN